MEKTAWKQRGKRHNYPIYYKNYKGNFQVKNVAKYVEQMRKKMVSINHIADIGVNLIVNTKDGDGFRRVNIYS